MLPMEVTNAASRGFRLFPAKKRAKTPLIAGWPHAATSDLQQLNAWQQTFGSCNWALATGENSGVFVLDVDGNDGYESLHRCYPDLLDLIATPTVSTARGQHIYFAWPKGRYVRNSAGLLGIGLDIRGQGGYVLVPPSIHPSGVAYEFVTPNWSLADAPESLLARICNFSPPIVDSAFSEGRRNDSLFRFACALRRQGASVDQLEGRLAIENLRRSIPPLPENEIAQIARSAAKYRVGGPDPLDLAWSNVLLEGHKSTFSKLISLARHLQNSRPALPIALPLERIAALMGVNWTAVRRQRQRAISEGRLVEVSKSVPHKRATLFIFKDVD